MTADTDLTAPSRRALLRWGSATAAAGLFGSAALTACAGPEPARTDPTGPGSDALVRLEEDTGVRIGAVGITADARVDHRAEEAFPMCSLFKVLAVAALLRERAYDDAYWAEPIPFGPADLVEDSPVTSASTTWAMSPTTLADAALRFSDNTAGNLLLAQLGGPDAITTFAADLGAASTRLDRWEPELNEAAPGDVRDTSTPSDIALLYRALLLEDRAGALSGARLRAWMLRNTTSDARIRAGLDGDVELADKTGAGRYGVVNDAGVLWGAGSDPITLVILTRTDDSAAVNDNEVVAEATRIIISELTRG
ncbi:class A beta-lactamase [Occultella gossypii]|uniref:Beta-lactamase n=1 Tax=Occultella gossypii TaxID=2800820 RepID=A0ABS7S2U9_9MICO|nr:class A beta-lactamase [Occultella gossypii]MBZ2194658.1 class A beta-lactamase [Occultella gossypii]